jgi:hypothetical protein
MKETVKAVKPSRPATGDVFTRDRFRWLDQVAGDERLHNPAVFKVAYGISSHVNRIKGYAYPSHARLASELNMSRRSVQRSLDALRIHGHLRIDVQKADCTVNRYWPVLATDDTGDPPVEGASPATLPYGESCATHDAPEPRPKVRHTGSKGAPIMTPGCATVGAQNPLNEPADKTIEGKDSISSPARQNSEGIRPRRNDKSPTSTHPKTETSDREFKKWWAQYPKKIGMEDARRIYKRIIRSNEATHSQLLAGALQYSTERAGQDPRYTKSPAGWLKDGRWTDEKQVQLTDDPFHTTSPTIRLDRGDKRRPSANEETCATMMKWAGMPVPEDFR